LLGFKANHCVNFFAYAINAVFIRKNFILALAQVNLWVPDLSDAPVAQSLNKSVGHASAANQIGLQEQKMS
jgi:hypothetical protein